MTTLKQAFDEAIEKAINIGVCDAKKGYDIYTPEDAIVNQVSRVAIAKHCKTITDQVEALTKERDIAVRKLAALSNADALEDLYQAGLGQEREITQLTKERDALAAAAKLALEAMEVATTPLATDRQEVLEAITALRQAGVQ